MSLMYKGFQSVLETKDGKKLWYPRLVKRRDVVTTHELATEISKRSSLTPGDTKNVIDNLMDTMRMHLMDSKSVCLDGLGTFTVICNAKGYGVETEEEVAAAQIKQLKVRFTPTYTRSSFEGVTRDMFRGVTFEKYDPKSKNSSDNGDDDDDYVDPDL